ncbi:hypothetical protein [Microvirga pudoricolor]|uniref:hypothetical protein n=1 Tax=Microvirga pudoricolor TaxID=2778729 RepID=UPI0019518E26|nr:hypothetical protein [Microvirga pudoricolor]MBM6595615.1 hypothetical protein [Microvirga pudoricolor]
MESLNPAPYSIIADALNKFHTASEPIQALALLCATAMVLGTVWSVCGVLRAVAGRGTTGGRFGRVLRVSSRPEHLILPGRDQTT